MFNLYLQFSTESPLHNARAVSTSWRANHSPIRSIVYTSVFVPTAVPIGCPRAEIPSRQYTAVCLFSQFDLFTCLWAHYTNESCRHRKGRNGEDASHAALSTFRHDFGELNEKNQLSMVTVLFQAPLPSPHPFTTPLYTWSKSDQVCEQKI